LKFFSISVLAISILSIVGLLAARLMATQDSSNNFVIANISRALRANLNAIAYTSISTSGAITANFTVNILTVICLIGVEGSPSE
jgi:Tfp pilus assembly protein PilV